MNVTSVPKASLAAVTTVGRGIAKTGALAAVVALWLAIIILRIKAPEERD